ncbi:MAG: ABC transporter permease subunit [Bacteroidales bacterium]|nr:ABC transporter permease subunit [Bacteroidales bacterium]
MITTLLKIEWRKVAKNRIFWIMLLLSFASLIAALLGLQEIIEQTNSNLKDTQFGDLPLLPTNIFIFPHVWHNIAFIARFLKIFLAVVMIILVTNEYTYNTLRQNLITGLSKGNLVVAKGIDAILLAATSTVILFVFGLVMGFISSDELLLKDVFRKIDYIGAYFIMLVGFLSFAMMIAFIVRKAAISIMVLLVYSYILELVLAFKYEEIFGNYLPLRNFNLLIEAPNIPAFQTMGISISSYTIPTVNLVLSVVYIAVFWGVSYLVLKKRDL